MFLVLKRLPCGSVPSLQILPYARDDKSIDSLAFRVRGKVSVSRHTRHPYHQHHQQSNS